MGESILLTIKKMLGIDDDDSFDTDLYWSYQFGLDVPLTQLGNRPRCWLCNKR